MKASAKIKHAWSARPTLKMGDFKLEEFNSAHTDILELDVAIAAMRHELRGLLVRRADKTKAMQILNSRALSGFLSAFGPDSPAYIQAGGPRRRGRGRGKK
jgi:hypothetical protein